MEYILPQKISDDLCLFFCLYSSSMHYVKDARVAFLGDFVLLQCLAAYPVRQDVVQPLVVHPWGHNGPFCNVQGYSGAGILTLKS